MADQINQDSPADIRPSTGQPQSDAPESGAANGAAGSPGAAQPDAALAEAEAKASEYYDAFLRSKAEMDNVRRRAQDDVAKAHKFAVEGFAESLLPVIDSLEAALKVENA